MPLLIEGIELAKSLPNSWSESLGNVQVLLEARIAREGAKAADLSIALTHLNRGRAQVEVERTSRPSRVSIIAASTRAARWVPGLGTSTKCFSCQALSRSAH